MKFTVTVDCDNAAFEDNLKAKLSKILKDLAKRIALDEGFDFSLRDSNGNKVGSSYLDDSEDCVEA